MIASRRRFLFGAATSLIAAPAIVRVAANLMPVSTKHDLIAKMLSESIVAIEDFPFVGDDEFGFRTSIPVGYWRRLNFGIPT